MREDLRRNLLAQKVVEKEVGEKATPSDADVTAFFEANKAQFNRTEDAVRIAQIVITPVREPQRTNRTGDDAALAAGGDRQGADADAALEGRRAVRRPRRGLLRGSRESAQRGGDLGFVPMSALAQAPPPLRDAVLQVQSRHRAAGQPGRRAHHRPGRRQGQEGPEGSEHAGSEGRRSARR